MYNMEPSERFHRCRSHKSVYDHLSFRSNRLSSPSSVFPHIFPISLYHPTEYNSTGAIGKENTDVEGITMSRETKAMYNEKRCRIFNYVMENPGRHLRGIMKELDVPNRTLRYHLEKMIKEGILVSRSRGIFKFYYPVGSEIDTKQLTPTQQKVIELLRDKPMMTMDLAVEMGRARTSVIYHLDKLREMGFVERRRIGKRYKWYVE